MLISTVLSVFVVPALYMIFRAIEEGWQSDIAGELPSRSDR
jgi:hypothetical protein